MQPDPNNPTRVDTAALPPLALAVIGSNLTAVVAESVAATTRYREFRAITRRATRTSLPVATAGDEWAAKLKQLPWLRARRDIAAFRQHIHDLTNGRPFDAFLHHSVDPYSQLLAGHPLCRRYFYLEEGFTSLVGGKFGPPKHVACKRLLWLIKSSLVYAGAVRKYAAFHDLTSPKYGGVYALSKDAFQGFPGRVQLPPRSAAAEATIAERVLVVLDSHYLIGNCAVDDYLGVMVGELAKLLDETADVAVKFHPRDTDAARRRMIVERIASVPRVRGVRVLPNEFVGERMGFDANVKVLVGTSALGYYLADAGFETHTFAPALAQRVPRFQPVADLLPQAFLNACARS